jgi:hypothetical protein
VTAEQRAAIVKHFCFYTEKATKQEGFNKKGPPPSILTVLEAILNCRLAFKMKLKVTNQTNTRYRQTQRGGNEQESGPTQIEARMNSKDGNKEIVDLPLEKRMVCQGRVTRAVGVRCAIATQQYYHCYLALGCL